MIILLQRVKQAQCMVNHETVASIGPGLLVYIGIEKNDAPSLIAKLADKIINVRIFEDTQGKLNLSALDKKCEVLLIPNFTLAGILESRRPSFDGAEDKEKARQMFEAACAETSKHLSCKKGVFSAHMEISSIADGPINLIVKL